MPHIHDKVIKMFQEKFRDKKITADSRIGVDFEADSLDKLEIVMELEDRFLIVIPEKRGQRVKTVQDAIEIVRTCL
jgi:acyl carrier protein